LTITKTHFTYRIDRWAADGSITLRQGGRVIEDSRKARVT
jgi:hypothetical protein